MPVLSGDRIAELLGPFVAAGPAAAPIVELAPALTEQLSTYLDLLVRWNTRVSLTSIRNPEEMVLRHFGESLFLAGQLGHRLPQGADLLDFGSGAGFPGLPVALALPGSRVTLAEAQSRKAAFLREVIRVLGISVAVWPERVEAMPAERMFDAVMMRAVDRMDAAVALAEQRVRGGGWLALLAGREFALAETVESYPLPEAESRVLVLRHVPRGTQAEVARVI